MRRLRVIGIALIGLALLLGLGAGIVWVVENPGYFQGERGSEGPQGPKGDKGDPGVAGTQGPRGPRGRSAAKIVPAPARSFRCNVEGCTAPDVHTHERPTADYRQPRTEERPPSNEEEDDRSSSKKDRIKIETHRSKTDQVIDVATSPVAAVILDRVLGGRDRGHHYRDDDGHRGKNDSRSSRGRAGHYVYRP